MSDIMSRMFNQRLLAEEAIKALEGSFACLLGSHGALATGPDISYAYSLAEHMEFCADIYLRAKMLGDPNILSNEQISEVIEKFLSSYSTQKK